MNCSLNCHKKWKLSLYRDKISGDFVFSFSQEVKSLYVGHLAFSRHLGFNLPWGKTGKMSVLLVEGKKLWGRSSLFTPLKLLSTVYIYNTMAHQKKSLLIHQFFKRYSDTHKYPLKVLWHYTIFPSIRIILCRKFMPKYYPVLNLIFCCYKFEKYFNSKKGREKN